MSINRRNAVSAIPADSHKVSFRINPSAMMYQLGGRMYPMVSDSNCQVCCSHSRAEIERALIRSYGYTMIWKSLPEQEQAKVSIRSITNHAKAHLPIPEAAKVAVVAQRAQEIGMDIEGSQMALIDHISFAKVALQDVFTQMAEGILRPDIKDGIAIANLLLKAQEAAGDTDLDQEAMLQGFMAYMSAMRQVCNEEQVARFHRILSANPVMKALWARTERPAITEGEVEYDSAEHDNGGSLT